MNEPERLKAAHEEITTNPTGALASVLVALAASSRLTEGNLVYYDATNEQLPPGTFYLTRQTNERTIEYHGLSADCLKFRVFLERWLGSGKAKWVTVLLRLPIVKAFTFQGGITDGD